MSTPHDDRSTYGAAMIAVAIVGALLAVGAFFLYGGKSAASTAFGTTLAITNLWAIGKVIRSMIPAQPESEVSAASASEAGTAPETRKGSTAAWGAFALLKVFLLFGLILAALHFKLVTPLGFLAGYGAMPVGIVMAQLARGMSTR